jgi:hypothetical protein
MRNTLAFLAAAVLVIAGLGWYLDWYKVGTVPAAGGHREVTIDINGKKVSADVKKGAEKGAEEIEGVLKKDHAAATQPGDSGKTITIKPRIVIGDDSPKPPAHGD